MSEPQHQIVINDDGVHDVTDPGDLHDGEVEDDG